jgi:hypothetical protein
MSFLTKLNKKRLSWRSYPAYRIVERSARIFVWGAALAIINYATVHWTGVGFDEGFVLKAALTGGVLAGLDKLKNEWRIIKEEYELNTWEGIISLFEKD